MKTAERIAWFIMPFQWMWRSCFDREAAVIAWANAVGLGPWWIARKLARRKR